jgi:L-gulonolactone oxidase
VLIGGLYPGLLPEWDYNLRAYTLELAFPVTIANKVLQRVRALFDAQAAKGIIMTSTYRSGINIKFGRPYNDLLGQVWTNSTDGSEWTKGAIMFDFPSYRPTWGDNLRFNEPFCGSSTSTSQRVCLSCTDICRSLSECDIDQRISLQAALDEEFSRCFDAIG